MKLTKFTHSLVRMILESNISQQNGGMTLIFDLYNLQNDKNLIYLL